MSVTVLSHTPRRTPLQRWLRKVIGAHDLVAVVVAQQFADGTTLTKTTWLDGVDVTRPLAAEGEDSTTIAIVPLPTPEDET